MYVPFSPAPSFAQNSFTIVITAANFNGDTSFASNVGPFNIKGKYIGNKGITKDIYEILSIVQKAIQNDTPELLEKEHINWFQEEGDDRLMALDSYKIIHTDAEKRSYPVTITK